MKQLVFSMICWALVGRRILYSVVLSVNKKGDNYNDVVVKELAQFKMYSMQIWSTFMLSL
jgi:hypothetical protein